MNAIVVAENADSSPVIFRASSQGALRASPFVAWLRAVAVAFFSFVALAQIVIASSLVARHDRIHARARWLHRWCRFATRVLGIRLKISGCPPAHGLLVCNHLSYLDIIVLCAVAPCVFVAKRDVAHWPVFGWLAQATGTIFVDRRSRIGAGRVADRMREALASQVLLVLFAEGTSSDGTTVLPFKSALLEPAVQSCCNITAGAIDYSLKNGSVANEVCYWRDMTLVPHLLNLFTKPAIGAKLVFAPFLAGPSNRKELACSLREQIIAMRS